jgi:MYXO-CTERM domain-containing protein
MFASGRTSKLAVALSIGAASLLTAGAASAKPNWQLVFNEPNQGNAILDMSAIDATHAWAVGISTEGSNQTPKGWVTSDGVSWTTIPLPAGGGGAMEFTIVSQVAFVDQNAGWMAGARVSMQGQVNLLWRSTTGGMSWDEMHQTPDMLDQIQVTSDWALFGVGANTVLRSPDGGQFLESSPSRPSGMDLVGVHMLTKDCGYLLAAPSADSGAMGSAILWTGDGGETWETRSESREFRLERAWFVSANLGWAVGVRNDQGIIAKTTDGGRTWSVAAAPNHTPVMNQPDEVPVTECKRVRFFDDKRGVALCLCCTGGCDGVEGEDPSYVTAFLRTEDGGGSWAMDPDYEPVMQAPPFGAMMKFSGMFAMAFPDPNTGYLGGQNNLILRYTAAAPEAAGWDPPGCQGSGGSGNGGSGTGGSSAGSADGDSDSGCGCRTGATAPRGLLAVALPLVLAWLARRRRTKR